MEASNALSVTRSRGKVHVLAGERLLFTSNVQRGSRPHIHPLMAPGTQSPMTRCRPVDHPWQYGVFTGLNLVNGYDFWCCGDAVYPPEVRGHISVRRAQVEVEEPERCILSCEADWTAPDDQPLLVETQRLVATPAHDDHYHVDVDWTLHPAGG